MRQKIFMISTGRTGTAFFASFFDDFFVGVESYHTTKNTELVNVLGNLAHVGIAPKKLTEKIFELIKCKWFDSHQECYVECNPYYWKFVEALKRKYPETKFVFVVRSPKGYIISHIQKENQSWRSKLANRFLPFWQPISIRDYLRYLSKTSLYERVDFYAKVWRVKNKELLMLREQMKNSRLIKFEDIFDSEKGVKTVKELLRWLELSPKKKLDGAILMKKTNVSQNLNLGWDEKCDEIVKKTCQNLSEKLGYAKR